MSRPPLQYGSDVFLSFYIVFDNDIEFIMLIKMYVLYKCVWMEIIFIIIISLFQY